MITDDEIRSLAISQRLLGTTEIILIHHTDCGMLTFSDDELKQQIQEDVGIKPHFSMSPSDLEEDAPVHRPYTGQPVRPQQGQRARLYLRGRDGPATRGHLTAREPDYRRAAVTRGVQPGPSGARRSGVTSRLASAASRLRPA